MRESRKIGEILVELQVLSPDTVRRILEAQKRRRGWIKFGQIGRDMGLLREEQILAALAVQLQLIPGIQQLSLKKILARLHEPVVAETPPRPQRTST
jgi:hypothetical protein